MAITTSEKQNDKTLDFSTSKNAFGVGFISSESPLDMHMLPPKDYNYDNVSSDSKDDFKL